MAQIQMELKPFFKTRKEDLKIQIEEVKLEPELQDPRLWQDVSRKLLSFVTHQTVSKLIDSLIDAQNIIFELFQILQNKAPASDDILNIFEYVICNSDIPLQTFKNQLSFIKLFKSQFDPGSEQMKVLTDLKICIKFLINP